MRVLVVGVGLQGRAVVHDLERTAAVTEVVAADLDARIAAAELERLGCRKAHSVHLDATDGDRLPGAVRGLHPHVVVCMVPPQLQVAVARAALAAGAHFVSTSYAGGVAELHAEAEQQGLVLLPEMGFDPGIDLVMARAAVGSLDEVHGLHMYGGGIPDAVAADNPLHYKVTWTFDGVLQAYRRPARVLRDGTEVAIPGERIFEAQHTATVDVPGVGTLEAYPNGDAVHYRELYGLGPALRDLGRFALRWPGHCALWRTMSALGFLDAEPVRVSGAGVLPVQFTARLLEPRLQYAAGERDLAILRVRAWGKKGGAKRSVVLDLLDRRDLGTGLFAMNRTVGYTASIGVQLILDGTITRPGLRHPARDVPPERLFAELRERGIEVSGPGMAAGIDRG
ncbi:MAG: saccharopine dehydrogenase NADP-binding domain-containing protein [Deltaproteobacteria bacterium]|nr:saccharopine dehydrogenase NADP-binding domain-containing protein [Deltaproteobacteria bacterium]